MFRSFFDHSQGDIFSLLQLLKIDSTATTRLGRARNNINTKHNKYNRHATTNQIILSLVTEVKKKYLPENCQRLTETCRKILRLLK